MASKVLLLPPPPWLPTTPHLEGGPHSSRSVSGAAASAASDLAFSSFAIRSSLSYRRVRRVLGLRLAAGARPGDGMGAAAAAGGEVVPGEEEESAAPKPRKPAPLEKGGTLVGERGQGKHPISVALGKPFSDIRWRNGSWDLLQFTMNGKVDWDAVIDAEASRRNNLEESPESTSSDDPVHFDISTIPWWAWIKRFRLPETEVLNVQVAVVGFFIACIMDCLTERGLVDQISSLIGRFVLFIVVVGIILVRKKEDLRNLRYLVKEWNSYDEQWQTAWLDQPQSPKKGE